MKIMLIHPDEPKSRYSSYAKVGSYLPPLGIAYIASVLEEDNHEVELLDNSIECLEFHQILGKVLEFEHDIIGVSSTSVLIPYSLKLGAFLEKEYPEAYLVLGGPGITAQKELLPYTG